MASKINIPVVVDSASDATNATRNKQPVNSYNRDENSVDIETDNAIVKDAALDNKAVDDVIASKFDTVFPKK